MNRLFSIVFISFIVSFPFVDAFAFSGTLNFSIIFSVILFGFFLIKGKYTFNTQTLLLIFFLINLVFSFIINYENGNSKLLNHSLAWFTSIILFFYSPLILFKKKLIPSILKTVYIIFYITILFSIVEYIDINLIHLGIANSIPRPPADEYNPWFIFGIRSRSFFRESGYFAMFVSLYLPIICYIERGRLTSTKNLLLFLFSAISMILTFSTTFFIILISLIIYSFILYKYKGFILRASILSIFLLIIYVCFKSTIDTVFDIVILSKFNSTSFTTRDSLNTDSLNYILHRSSWIKMFIGFGPGSYDYLGIDAAISTYINIFRDLGLLGLLSFILFYVSVFVKLLKSKDVISKYLLISVFCSMVYFQTNTSYYFAFSWFVIILALKTKLFTEYESTIKCCNRML